MKTPFLLLSVFLQLALLFFNGTPSGLAFVDAASNDISCPDHCRTAENETAGTHDVFRIFYVILVHNQESLDDAVHLFRAIRDPRNIIAIHVDAKARHLLTTHDNNQPPPLLLREIEACPCGSQVKVDSVHDVQWSQWSMNLPTFWGLEVAVTEFPNQWDVFVNLAGNTLPVFTTDTMAAILQDLPYNFVTSSSCETGLRPTNVYEFPRYWHKRRHYTVDDTEPDPVLFYTDQQGRKQNQTIEIHFGSQWVILQREFCEWLVQEMRRPDSMASVLAAHLRESGKKMTDETYLATLIMHTAQFNSTLPQVDEDEYLLWRNQTSSRIRDIRYERMDEHVPTAFGYLWEDQRYDVPEKSRAGKPRPWGPYYLGVYDLANIRASGALFVRKISTAIDPNMVRIFPVSSSEDIPDIDWPDEVLIADKPRWKERLRAIYEASQSEVEREAVETDDEEL